MRLLSFILLLIVLIAFAAARPRRERRDSEEDDERQTVARQMQRQVNRGDSSSSSSSSSSEEEEEPPESVVTLGPAIEEAGNVTDVDGDPGVNAPQVGEMVTLGPAIEEAGNVTDVDGDPGVNAPQVGEMEPTVKATTTKKACVDSCPLEYNPVCGNDGVIYPSECVFKAIACENADENVKILYTGSCVDQAGENELNP